MHDESLISAINTQLNIQLQEGISTDELQEALAAYCNELIKTGFEKLVSLLYRIDVSEAKLKSLLQQSPGTDAGELIARLIIERQQQKLKTRRDFSRRANDIDEEEKW